jgi:transposase
MRAREVLSMKSAARYVAPVNSEAGKTWHIDDGTAPDGGPVGKNPVRRVFSADYKLAILAEFDRCTEPGEKGALLRREGLYSSLITDWRRQHRQGLLKAALGRTDGGRGGPSLSELAKLRAENERLKEQLAKARVVIEVQGKVHALLDELSKSADSELPETPFSAPPSKNFPPVSE